MSGRIQVTENVYTSDSLLNAQRGRIEPGHQVEVQGEQRGKGLVETDLTEEIVLLQAMKEDPPPDAKCKDKFLVQSIQITPERDSGNIQTIVGCITSYMLRR